MADGFGVEVEEIKSDFDMYIAPETFTTVGGLTINKGTISAIRWSLAAIVNGRPRFSINHVTRARWDCGPDWPNIGTDGGYRVEIDGFPPLRCDFPMALPGGTGSSFADAMAMTAARCVNAIEAVVEAPTGYLTFRELKPIGGKLLLAP
jgi:4-hydroxy-tetrahydrodipicolinate reductase